MPEPKTYWLVDRTGNKALIEGQAERDRWLPHGWVDAEPPSGGDFLWASFDGVADPARFPADAFAEVWEPKGWKASAPPEPVDPITGVRPPRPTPETTAAPAETSKQSTATGGEKEKSRG